MAYSIEQLSTRYERFSNRVPYFPQAVAMLVLVSISGWLTFNVARLYALSLMMPGERIDRGDAFMVLPAWLRGEAFTNLTDLTLHLIGMAVVAVLMSWMPLFHEFNREPHQNRIVDSVGKIWASVACVAAILHLVAFTLWSVLAAFFLSAPTLFGITTLDKSLIVAPVVIATHLFVMYTGFQAIWDD